MIKLVAFDWNGTILSDTTACLAGDDAALVSLGCKPISLQKFRETFEIPLVNFYKNLGIDPSFPKDRYELSETIFHRVYEARAAKARTRAGTRSLLAWLKNPPAGKRVPAVIFSNHIKQRIEEQLHRLKINNYIDTVLANDHTLEVIYNRWKGEKLKAYLKIHNIKPNEVLVVGDTVEEVEIARELGGISVALTHGYNSTGRLKAAKPDYLLGDLRQIEKIIVNVNKQPQK